MLDREKVLEWIKQNYKIGKDGHCYISYFPLYDAITNGDFDVKEDSK